MKKALLVASILFIAVITTACINNIAVQELNNKAAEYLEKGDYDAAVNRLQASLDLDSTAYETHYNLGIAATKAEKYDIALEAFENGLKIKPDYSNFYYSLAVAQAEYSDEILDDSAEDSKDEITEENKTKAEELKKQAILNAEKYLELSPKAEDADEVKDFILDLKKEEDTEEQPTVLKG